MSFPRLFADSGIPLVADASAIINLNGSGAAEQILQLVPHPFVVVRQAVKELEDGRNRGHSDADRLAQLIDNGHVEVRDLGKLGSGIFESLVSGATLQTLDDGEAASIALAVEINGIVVIDERKAMTLCGSRFPSLEVVSTSCLLVHEQIQSGLGERNLADAVFGALQSARMRVPTELVEQVVALIGRDRALLCPSLPRSARR